MTIKKIAENYADYDETNSAVVKKLTEEVDKCFTTYVYLENRN